MDKNYTIIEINPNDSNEVLNDYVTSHNTKFGFYFINCDFKIEFHNNFTTNIEFPYLYKTNITDIQRYLLYDIYYFISSGHKVNKINQMTINSISDKSNMTYKHYLNQPMHMCEKKINMNIAKSL